MQPKGEQTPFHQRRKGVCCKALLSDSELFIGSNGLPGRCQKEHADFAAGSRRNKRDCPFGSKLHLAHLLVLIHSQPNHHILRHTGQVDCSRRKITIRDDPFQNGRAGCGDRPGFLLVAAASAADVLFQTVRDIVRRSHRFPVAETVSQFVAHSNRFTGCMSTAIITLNIILRRFGTGCSTCSHRRCFVV